MDEAGRIPAAAATLLHLSVKLIDQGRHRQARAVGLRLFEADTQVLAHPVDGEAELALAVHHGVAAVRSEERRVGNECVSTGIYRWVQSHLKKTDQNNTKQRK